MKEIIKKYAGLVVIILIAFVVVYFIQKRKINRLTETAQLQAIELAQLQDSVQTYDTRSEERRVG